MRRRFSAVLHQGAIKYRHFRSVKSVKKFPYRPIAHDVTAPVTMHLEDKLATMHNITFVNKANFVKLYNNFVLKWLIFALYVVVVPEQIIREHLEDTLRICDVSAMGL